VLFRYDGEEWLNLISRDNALASMGWTKEETDYLLDMLETHDLRFVVVADRYNVRVKHGTALSPILCDGALFITLHPERGSSESAGWGVQCSTVQYSAGVHPGQVLCRQMQTAALPVHRLIVDSHGQPVCARCTCLPASDSVNE
jgi:SANT/Myb-like domain of DAMP1